MGPQNESDSIPAIHAALDLGLNWIDTTALYGLGHTEEVVSQALRGRGPHPYVFTKCERVWDASGAIGACLKAASIRKECEDSLRRLQADGIAPITSLQPPIRLSLARSRKKFFPSPLRENIGVIVYSPMSAGLLTGAMTRERVANFSTEDWRRNLPNFQEPLLSRNLKLVESLRAIGNRYGRTLGEIAIAWTLKNPAVTGAIVGFRNPKQVSGIIGATEILLQPTEMAEIGNALKHEGIN
jgi:aryl-alcohol dehydrogenase-like predicted oxidoreductase